MNSKAGETGVADLLGPLSFPTAQDALGRAGSWPRADEDAELIVAVRAGSEEAFDRLIARYHASVYNLVYRMVGDPGDAADAVQEVFLKVFRGLRKFHARASLKTWIYRIAVHEGCNRRRWWRRHRWRETSLEAPAHVQHAPGWLETNGGGKNLPLSEMLAEEGPSPLEQVVSLEARRALDQALAGVPELYRTAVVLRDLEEFSYEEMAQVFQVSVGTVKSRVARGREALRQHLAGLLQPEHRAGLPLRGRP